MIELWSLVACPIPQSLQRWWMVHYLASLVGDPTQHLGQGLGCSDLLTEGGDSTSFRVPSSVNRRLWAVGDGEWYLHLK